MKIKIKEIKIRIKKMMTKIKGIKIKLKVKIFLQKGRLGGAGH